MSDKDLLYCLVAFILGWLTSRMMGNGFSVGGEISCTGQTLPKRMKVPGIFEGVFNNCTDLDFAFDGRTEDYKDNSGTGWPICDLDGKDIADGNDECTKRVKQKCDNYFQDSIYPWQSDKICNGTPNFKHWDYPTSKIHWNCVANTECKN